MTTSAQKPPVGHMMISLLEAFIWLDQGLQQNLAASGLPHVRRLESMVMLYAAAGLQRPSDLARTLGVTRQSINSAIRELEEKSLVELKTDPDDKRCKIVSFTQSGLPVRLRATEIMQALEGTLAKRIGTQNIQALLTALNTERGQPPVFPETSTAKKRVGAKKNG